MNKRKETVAKILTLLDGLSYKEINQIICDVKDELESALWSPSPDITNVISSIPKDVSGCTVCQ